VERAEERGEGGEGGAIRLGRMPGRSNTRAKAVKVVNGGFGVFDAWRVGSFGSGWEFLRGLNIVVLAAGFDPITIHLHPPAPTIKVQWTWTSLRPRPSGWNIIINYLPTW
jgi:hypothetical protein